MSAAANLIQEAAHEDANIIFGTVIDDALGDEVKVTVIAAGFEGGSPPRRQPGISRAADLRANRPGPATMAGHSAAAAGSSRNNPFSSEQAAPRPATPPVSTSRPAAPAADDDDLDVPDFLK